MPRLAILAPLAALVVCASPDLGRPAETHDTSTITAAAADSLRRQIVELDGTVDASVAYLRGATIAGATHDVFFLTTSYGRTEAIDADAGTVLWRFTPPGFGDWARSYRITNSTPVVDPDHTAIYAASPDGHVQKLAIADGHAVWSTAITLLAAREKIAAPLAFSRGHVIAATGGYIGDAPPYQGHVAVLDASSGKVLHIWNSLCSDRSALLDPANCAESGSAIWGRAGVVVDSASGNLFIATGNGRWDGRSNWGDAVIELDADASRVLANYTPENTAELNDSDADIGSTSPVLLDATHLVQGGKDGHLRLLDLSTMTGTTPHKGGEVQIVETPGGGALFTAPAVLRAKGATWLFVADNAGTAAWTWHGGRLTAAWTNENAGTSPVVSGALLYVYDPGGALRIYEAITGKLVTALSCGAGHWNIPLVADGRIALPEGGANSHRTDGVLNIWRAPRR